MVDKWNNYANERDTDAHSTTADPKDAEITEAQFDTLANPPLSTDLAASTSTTTSAAQAVSRMRITPDRAAVVAAMSEAELKAKRSTYTTTKVYRKSASSSVSVISLTLKVLLG